MKARIHPYISDLNYARLSALAARPDKTISTVTDDAFSAYFTSIKDDERDAAIIRRLDRLTRQFDRLEKHDTVVGETLALYVRYFLMVTPQVPAVQLDAARAKGEQQFEAFLDQLGRDLQSGKRHLERAVDDVIADATDFFTDAEIDRLHQPAPERGEAAQVAEEARHA